jgi:hypothetical protein
MTIFKVDDNTENYNKHTNAIIHISHCMCCGIEYDLRKSDIWLIGFTDGSKISDAYYRVCSELCVNMKILAKC